MGDREKGREVVMYAFSLIDIGYRFGGKNPDCGPGLQRHGGLSLSAGDRRAPAPQRRRHRPAGAADRARIALQAGDLVFFNTRNKPYSHVGIYVGDDRFVHAPSRNGKIELASLSDRYFDQRFDSARTLLKD
ncbi:MAG: NlpC/P60 family protein [Comamonadaceae bacterium]|nr:NlpC/P60 family protein [Comamonadaceae bacterium]